MMKKGRKYITITLIVEPDGGQYAAHCVELGTASCGDTIEEALANIEEAVFVDLNALEHIGERARFFRQRGIRMKSSPRKREVGVTRKVYPGAFTTVVDTPVPVSV